MTTRNPDRASYFPAIEKKYGQPMSYWFDVMSEIKDRKYPEQMAYLMENHAFSRSHANALVLYSRGSTSSRRFEDLDGYLANVDEEKSHTVREIFAVLQKKFPELQLVIAWNQPMLKNNKGYVFGLSVSQNHITIAPFNAEVLAGFTDRFAGYKMNKKTVQVPSDWKVDKKLLTDLIAANLAAM